MSRITQAEANSLWFQAQESEKYTTYGRVLLVFFAITAPASPLIGQINGMPDFYIASLAGIGLSLAGIGLAKRNHESSLRRLREGGYAPPVI